MYSNLRFVISASVVGCAGLIGVLALLPATLEDRLLASAELSAPAARPCKQQIWLNLDRNCLTRRGMPWAARPASDTAQAPSSAETSADQALTETPSSAAAEEAAAQPRSHGVSAGNRDGAHCGGGRDQSPDKRSRSAAAAAHPAAAGGDNAAAGAGEPATENSSATAGAGSTAAAGSSPTAGAGSTPAAAGSSPTAGAGSTTAEGSSPTAGAGSIPTAAGSSPTAGAGSTTAGGFSTGGSQGTPAHDEAAQRHAGAPRGAGSAADRGEAARGKGEYRDAAARDCRQDCSARESRHETRQ